MPKENEKFQTFLEKEFEPKEALKSHPGFYERLMKTALNPEAVEAWLGMSLAELKKQGYT